MNRSISGRVFEIGSDGDDGTVGDISIFHCYRKEVKLRMEHLQKLQVTSLRLRARCADRQRLPLTDVRIV